MKDRLRWIGTRLSLLIAAGVLAFGAHTAFASTGTTVCDPSYPGYVGECPPLDEESCTPACAALFGPDSAGNDCGGGCCICSLR